MFYDVSYDRTLSPPAAALTPNGIPGGASLCPGTKGTQVGFEEEIDADLTKLDDGGGINSDFLPRDPANGCAPVYPHSYLRVNSMRTASMIAPRNRNPSRSGRGAVVTNA